ncbi:serine O-acetyltransferase [Quadrisphaera oryzae]|uniref:serine O-acetyltransferase n=1 Tax=Quadrisphaera TaxID=317661 RepID=UPI00164905C2|nr:serine acetyltransferase [Quadrisphaera sp. RL12-1S]
MGRVIGHLRAREVRVSYRDKESACQYNYWLQDWRANAGRPQFQVLLLLFRVAQDLRRKQYFAAPLASFVYRAYALAVCSVDLPTSTEVGSGLAIHHGFGLTVNAKTVLGRDVVLRQGVTLGSTWPSGGAPHVGDGVSFGPQSVALGDIKIGSAVIIGAGAVVVKSIPAGRTVVGNPAKQLGERDSPEPGGVPCE